MNLLNVLTVNGDISWRKVYVEAFNKLPSTYTINLDQKNYLDIRSIKAQLEKFFPNCEFWYSETNCDEITTSSQEIVDELNDASFIDPDLRITIKDNIHQRIIILSEMSFTVYHQSNDDIKQFIDMEKSLPTKIERNLNSMLNLVAYDNGYYYTIKSSIKTTDANVADHYNDDFQKIYDDTIKFLNEKETGLILYHGQKGAGKTQLIRHLVSKTNKKYLLITNAVAAHIGEPEFISFLMRQRDSIFILEDCEQILMEREQNIFGGAIANILNMSDGLLSDIFNIKFICTFNTGIDKIDKALLRKGRCKINYEFKPLAKNKVEILNKKHNLGIENPDDMTLAEIYNYTKEEIIKKPRKIGF